MRAQRRLYFDIFGTIIPAQGGPAKPCLANGALESALRRCGFTSLVCVSTAVTRPRARQQADPGFDALGVILDLCRGAFGDGVWFRQVAELSPRPDNRAAHIDLQTDWWYVDDLAADYCEQAGLRDLFARETGRRIFTPRPHGDGSRLVAWLAGVVSCP